jgi:hypothetical protein
MRAESDKLSILSFETRLGNLESQSLNGLPSPRDSYNSCTSNNVKCVKGVERAVTKVLNMYVR